MRVIGRKPRKCSSGRSAIIADGLCDKCHAFGALYKNKKQLLCRSCFVPDLPKMTVEEWAANRVGGTTNLGEATLEANPGKPKGSYRQRRRK